MLHLFPDTYNFIEELNHTDMLKGVADEAFGTHLWKTDPISAKWNQHYMLLMRHMP